MALEDWQGILIPHGDCTEVYRRIFRELGIKHPIEIEQNGCLVNSKTKDYDWELEPSEELRKQATEVGKVAKSSEKKPLVIGLGHHLIADLGNPRINNLIWDAHVDGSNQPFNSGSFLCYMDGHHFIIGDTSFPDIRGRNVTQIMYYQAESILEKPIGDEIFVSYCIDVLGPNYTTAHKWDKNGKMSPSQISKLTTEILRTRMINGMNVATYRPNLEKDTGYQTVNIIVNLLGPNL